MKKLKIFAVLVFCAAGIIVACHKENSSNNSTSSQTRITTDRSLVKAGETVSLSVQNGTPGAVVKWNVIPKTNVSVSRAYSWDQKNTITFNAAGDYAVSAEIKKVWCDSVAAAHPGMDTCLNSGTVTATVQTTIKVTN